jgi:hypothetical protein
LARRKIETGVMDFIDQLVEQGLLILSSRTNL